MTAPRIAYTKNKTKIAITRIVAEPSTWAIFGRYEAGTVMMQWTRSGKFLSEDQSHFNDLTFPDDFDFTPFEATGAARSTYTSTYKAPEIEKPNPLVKPGRRFLTRDRTIVEITSVNPTVLYGITGKYVNVPNQTYKQTWRHGGQFSTTESPKDLMLGEIFKGPLNPPNTPPKDMPL